MLYANVHASGVCICKKYRYVILSTQGIRGLKAKALKCTDMIIMKLLDTAGGLSSDLRVGMGHVH